MRATDVRVRFASKHETDERGCWVWRSNRNNQGYGTISVGGRRGGMRLAHRVSWELHRGALDAGQFVLHRCDNPACVNPDHLFLGSHADNMRDMASKGRRRGGMLKRARGEANLNARLDAGRVREIRERSERGESMRSIAKSLGVGESSIRDVIHGRTWRHVA